MKKYKHPLTAQITPENWQEKLNLQNLSLEDISTLLGDFKAMEAMGKKLAGFLREVALSRMEDDEYEGPYFILERSTQWRSGSLDKELIMEEMGEEWIETHSKEGQDVTVLRVTAKKE